jgi:hypothetical protein
MLSSYFGPSVAIRANGDTDYVVTDAYSGASANDELGLAQPIYMHNVIPASHGYQSVDFTAPLDNSCAGQDGFDTMILMKDFNGLNHFLSPAGGQNFVSYNGETWNSSTLSSQPRMSGEVTFAYVKQETYVCYKNHGVFKYDPFSKTLQPVELFGIDSSEISGITSALGMIIAWTDDTIYRSSFENPVDFTPSLRTGAGSQQLISLRGQIVAALPHTEGFIVYSTENAIYARSTGDLAYPFNYNEVEGASGIISAHHVASDTTYGVHYAWTKAGLQTVRNDQAKLMFAEVTDFLTCGYIEDYINSWDDKDRIGSPLNKNGYDPFYEGYYSECPNNLIMTAYEKPLEIKVNVVSTRYLAISYGIGELSHVLVYDLGLQRFGKLRIPHVDIFNYQEPETFGVDTARNSFGLLQKNGTIRLMNMKLSQPATDAVFMFGRLSLSRASITLMDTIHLSGMFDEAGGFKMNTLISIDGMTMLEDVYLIPFHDTKQTKVYGARVSGKSHVLKMTGTFSLNGIEVEMFDGGNR